MRRLIPVLLLLLLSGCNTVVPYLNVYDGLFPANYQLMDSTEPIRTESLKGKTAVIVTSTNFNSYTTQWQDYYEKGGDEKQKGIQAGAAAILSLVSPLMGSGAANDARDVSGDRVRQASDPRNVVVMVYSALQPYFKTIKPAADFAEARDMKADYIFLIDFYGTWNQMGDRYRTQGGAYVLDGSLRRVFQAEGKADVEREGGGLFSSVGVIEGTARTLTKGLDITVNQMLAQVRAKLGPAPREDQRSINKGL